MFCPNCGKQLNDGVKFCSGCGWALSAVGEEPSPSPAAPQQPAAAQPQYQPQPQYQQPAYAPQPQQQYAQQANPAQQQYPQQTYAPQNGYYFAPQPGTAAKKKPSWALIVIVLAVLAAGYYFFMDRDPEQAVRTHVFAKYGDATIETALAGGIPDSTWTWSSKRNSLNDYTVTADGKIESIRVSLVFTVTYSGRTPTVQLSEVSTGGGERITATSELNDILKEIYSDYSYYRR